MQTVSCKSCVLSMSLMVLCGGAVASGPSSSAKVAAEPQVTVLVPQFVSGHGVLIGRETDKLLAMQRSNPGSRPKPIDGDQALRSYQRYLKSFEHPIPDAYEAGMEMKK